MTPAAAGPHLGIDRLVELAAAERLAPACERFHFLRHGQTECNARRIFQSPDEPLNAAGLAQAERAAALLAGEPLGAIVCSDLPRTRQTAETVARHHALAPVFAEGLRERHFGGLIGTSSARIDWACAPEGGETLEIFVARTRQALASALSQSGSTLVVAHGGTLYVLAALLGVAPHAALFGNALPLRFERRAGGRWNATPLEPAAGTAQALNLS